MRDVQNRSSLGCSRLRWSIPGNPAAQTPREGLLSPPSAARRRMPATAPSSWTPSPIKTGSQLLCPDQVTPTWG